MTTSDTPGSSPGGNPRTTPGAEAGVPALAERIIESLANVGWKPHLFLLRPGEDETADGLRARLDRLPDESVRLTLTAANLDRWTEPVCEYAMLDDHGVFLYSGFLALPRRNPAGGAECAATIALAPEDASEIGAITILKRDRSPELEEAVRWVAEDEERPVAVREAARAALTIAEPVPPPTKGVRELDCDRRVLDRPFVEPDQHLIKLARSSAPLPRIPARDTWALLVAAAVVVAVTVPIAIWKPFGKPDLFVGIPRPIDDVPRVVALKGGPFRLLDLGANPGEPYELPAGEKAYRIADVFVDFQFTCTKAGHYRLVLYRTGKPIELPPPTDPNLQLAGTQYRESGIKTPTVGERLIVFAVVTPTAAEWLDRVAEENVPSDGFEAWVKKARPNVPWVEVVRFDLEGVRQPEE
jgi:hypothetical protein